MSAFASVALAPPIEVFKLTKDYKADAYEQKINLGVGAYRYCQANSVLRIYFFIELNASVLIRLERGLFLA